MRLRFDLETVPTGFGKNSVKFGTKRVRTRSRPRQNSVTLRQNSVTSRISATGGRRWSPQHPTRSDTRDDPIERYLVFLPSFSCLFRYFRAARALPGYCFRVNRFVVFIFNGALFVLSQVSHFDWKIEKKDGKRASRR